MSLAETPVIDSGDSRPLALAAHPYRALGGFRFLLATLVLVSHASGYLPTIVSSLSLGNVGVLLFFVVSGFVICEALDLFYRNSTRRFLLNRALKIFPAYWAALPLSYAARFWAGEPAASDPFGLAVNATLLLAYLPRGGDLLVISVAWAVVVEFQFYFAAAAAFRLVRQRNGGVVLVTVALAALAAYAAIWWRGDYARFYGSLQFAPFFLLGALLYFSIARRERRLLPLVGLAFLASVQAYYAYNARGLPPGFAGLAGNVVVSTVIYASLAGIMVSAVLWRIPRGFERVDKRLGDLTYAVYLVHPAVIFAMAKLQVGDAVGFAGVALGSLVLAIAIRLLVERPVVGLRNRLRGRRLYE